MHARLAESWRGLSGGEYRGVEESTSTREEYIGFVGVWAGKPARCTHLRDQPVVECSSGGCSSDNCDEELSEKEELAGGRV